MKTLTLILSAGLILPPSLVFAQTAVEAPSDERTFRAHRVETPPVVDGVIDDDCWDTCGEWSGTFTQQEPDEGLPSTQTTRVKILYDNQYIYVAFRNYDTEPDRINRWLAPRDQIQGDAVCICFDSYHDKRTAFAFALTAGGTRADFLIQNTSNDDYTWNAVWDGKTSADAEGWYAEYRIPLSQLRYSDRTDSQQWGVHAIRLIDRHKENTHLHLIRRQNRGYVYEFATLTGIGGLPRSRRIELSPYASLKYITSEKEEGNPYKTGREWGYGAGLDGKIGLSSDFTLDFTINPDFGQVEADPSTINLTSFETRYEEKRPFFLEGKSIFNILGEDMFYSRRIGSPPQWSPGEEYGEYSRVPSETTIISALKVSGKSRKGLSLSVLNSITAREKALITQDGREYEMTAQPLTSYSVARVQQDIDGGNTIVGGFLTAVNRSIRDDHLKFLPRNAWTGALDFSQYLLDREYYLTGSFQFSRVDGTREAITRLQEAPVHYFQRDGAPHIEVDPAMTHMAGNAGNIYIGRGGKSKLAFENGFSWRTPGVDLNDAGFLSNADRKMLRGYVLWRENDPSGNLFRNYSYDIFYNFVWDYGGQNLQSRAGVETNISFTNKYGLYFCGFYDFKAVENTMLRGGPPVLLNPRWGTDLFLNTDQSKKVSGELYHGTMLGRKRYAQYFNATVKYRPIPNLGLSARFDYTYKDMGLEYAADPELESGPGRAYVMSNLDHTILGLTLRVDYSITPDLSIQFYGNPFISYGKYTDFKRATDTLDPVYENRFRRLGADVLTFDAAGGSYLVAERGGDRYSFDNPDFSFREFRFNLVVRWEYRPNSIFYLVWGQDRSGSDALYNSSFGQNADRLFSYTPTNVFMAKFNYWFSL
jgi:hypothetical protein